MTMKEQMSEQLREKEVERISSILSGKLSRKDFREAKEALGIERSDEDEYGTLIILAKKQKATMTYQELDEMGMKDLFELVFGAELLPEELQSE